MKNAREMIVGTALLLFFGSAALLPLWTDQVAEDDPRRHQASLDTVAQAFLDYHEETGLWPCAWTGDASSITLLNSFQCLQRRGLGGKVVDEWGRLLRVVYQARSGEVPGAANGAVALVSPGPNGTIETRVVSAIDGVAEGDDLVRVVARSIE